MLMAWVTVSASSIASISVVSASSAPCTYLVTIRFALLVSFALSGEDSPSAPVEHNPAPEDWPVFVGRRSLTITDD
jgi:hypothetical protein